jgi:hypothetical protein
MTDPVLAALIEVIVAIELADESLVDLDFSVGLTEQLGQVLRTLPAERRREFARAAEELASTAAQGF